MFRHRLFPAIFLLLGLMILGSAQAADSKRELAARKVDKSNEFFEKKQYTEALELCAEAAKIDPDFARAYVGMGINHEKLGNWNSARDAYLKALDSNPTASDSNNAKAGLNRVGWPPKPEPPKLEPPKLEPPVATGPELFNANLLRNSVFWQKTSAFYNEKGPLMLPMGAMFEALQWAKSYDAATGEVRWSRDGAQLRHIIGTRIAVLVTPTAGRDNEERLDFGTPSVEVPIAGTDTAFAPANLFARAMGATFSATGWHTFTFNTTTAPPKPLDPPFGATVRAQRGNALDFTKLDGSDESRLLANSVAVRRALSTDALVAQKILANGAVGLGDAIKASDLAPGEAAFVTLNRQGEISQILAVALLAPEIALSISPNQIELASYPNKPFRLDEKLRFVDALGFASTNPSVLLAPNTPVAVFINPRSKRLYQISILESHLRALGPLLPLAPPPVAPPSEPPVSEPLTPMSGPIWQGHRGVVQALARSPYTLRNQWVASGGVDGTVRIWRRNGAPLSVAQAGAPVTALAVAPDGSRLAAGRSDGKIAVWNLAGGNGPNGAPTSIWNAPRDAGAATALDFSANSALLAAAYQTSPGVGRGKIGLFDAQTGNLLPFAPSPLSTIGDLIWTGKWLNGNPLLAVADGRYPVVIYEIDVRLNRANSIKQFRDDRLNTVVALDFDEKTRLLFAGDSDGTVHSWSLDANEQAARQSRKLVRNEDLVPNALAVSPDSGQLAVGLGDGRVRLLNTRGANGPSVKNNQRAPRTAILALAWLGDERILVAREDGSLTVREVK